jgi:hypothetical protein
MKLEEAHRILDEQKDGTRIHPNHVVRTALRATGDIGRTLPAHTRPFDRDGINEWMESTRLAQGEGDGQRPDRDLAGNQQGFNGQNEGNK